jgi:hypothetical protein
MDTRQILSQLRDELSRITRAIAALESLDGTIPAARPARKAAVRGRGMSAEGRKRLSEMMKKRWAERKKKGAGSAAGGRHMSAAARKRISQMMKKRWAERKKKAKAA